MANINSIKKLTEAIEEILQRSEKEFKIVEDRANWKVKVLVYSSARTQLIIRALANEVDIAAPADIYHIEKNDEEIMSEFINRLREILAKAKEMLS